MRDWKRRIGTILLALLMVWTSVNWSMETKAGNSISVTVTYVDENNDIIYQTEIFDNVDGSKFRYEIPGSEIFQYYLDRLTDGEMMCMYMTKEDSMPGVTNVYWDRDNDESYVKWDLLSGEIGVGPGDQLVFALDDSDGIPTSVEATIHLSSMESEDAVEVNYRGSSKQGEIEFDKSPILDMQKYYARKYIHQTEFDIPLAKDEDISKSEGYEHIKVLKWMLINNAGIEEAYNCGEQYQISLGASLSVGVSFEPVLGQTITTKFVDKDGKTIEGVEDISRDVEIGATYSTPAKEIPGYTLIGESDNEEKTMMPEKAETVTYRYRLDTYDISYDLAGGTLAEGETNPTSYNVETATFTLKNPTRAGYTFKGWTGSNGTTPSTAVNVTKGTTGDLTYEANWEINEYGITYDLAGGALKEGEENPATYNVETATFTLKNPTREGYTFKGWTSSGVDKPSTSVSVVKGTTGELEFTAVWEEIKKENKENTEDTEIAPASEHVEEVIETVATQISYGIQKLIQGTKYSFAAGTTYKVSGDETIYTGGNDFYVSSDGEYEFTMVEE